MLREAIAQMLNLIKFRSLLLLNLLLCGTACHALDTDKYQPLNIMSESSQTDYINNIITYLGNAVAIQGTTKLTGDKIMTYIDDNSQLSKLIAYGSDAAPATYSTLPRKKSSLFFGSANIITYLADEKMAVFDLNAYAAFNENTFKGPNFRYYTERGEVLTTGSKTSRVSISLKEKN
jgi:lipopolysaccharide export system protein LptA